MSAQAHTTYFSRRRLKQTTSFEIPKAQPKRCGQEVEFFIKTAVANLKERTHSVGGESELEEMMAEDKPRDGEQSSE